MFVDRHWQDMVKRALTKRIGALLRKRGIVKPSGHVDQLDRFGRDDDGATAVEFAMLAFPFLALLLAIIEVGLIFFATQVMETGVEGAARLIRTGQAQGFNETQFKQEICDRVTALFNCNAMKIDVRTHEQFSGINLDKPINDSQELDDSDFGFDPGVGGDIVVVRAFYEWPIVVSFLGDSLGDLANGNRLLVSASTFRNEPF